MLRSTFMIVSLFCFSLGFTSCSKYIYVEEPTPSGQIAPRTTENKAKNKHEPEIKTTSDRREPQKESLLVKNIFITEEFRTVYKAIGSPRIVIYLNRSLSDNILEWHTVSRKVISLTRQSNSVDKTANLSVYKQQYIQDPERYQPEESWMWSFEEGFLGSFLNVGANLVDRATIMRLTAATADKPRDMCKFVQVKELEMKSLIDKADLLIEILINKNARTQLGYEFKATVKEVVSGIIRANVTSLNWKDKHAKKIIATTSGYQVTKDKDVYKLPQINIVAEKLAISVMEALTKNYNNHKNVTPTGKDKMNHFKKPIFQKI